MITSWNYYDLWQNPEAYKIKQNTCCECHNKFSIGEMSLTYVAIKVSHDSHTQNKFIDLMESCCFECECEISKEKI